MSAVYDKTGREIMLGDVLKVFHYTAALRRRKVYMYKHVIDQRVWESGFTAWKVSHLTFDPKEHYYIALDGRVLEDYEIVQSIDACWEDRPKVGKTNV